MSPQVSTQEIVDFYEPKTQALLKRYGPGPRVHYHTGLVDESLRAFSLATESELRQQIVSAQERMLQFAASVWDARSTLCGDVLDVGCGLGGGSLFWAQEFGAQVTAVTCVPSQVQWVDRFAEQAGVSRQVQPVLCDAVTMPGENCFDTAVAIESCCHMPRRELFQRLAVLLRPGGRLFIADCFLGHSDYQEPFDCYWHTRIGSIEEYICAARESGFREESIEDTSSRTVHFWTMTLNLIQAETQNKRLSDDERKKHERSLQEHARLRQGLANGGLRYALLSFVQEKQPLHYQDRRRTVCLSGAGA